MPRQKGKLRDTRKIKIIPAHSPNHDDTNIKPEYIVIHCIGYKNPLENMLQNNVSCHYLIPKQDLASGLIVYEVVKPPLRAWHAGVSQWRNSQNFNNNAIGIEIHMPNYAHAIDGHPLNFLYFEEFESSQIDALKLLIRQLQGQYNIPAENVLAHSDIAPWRNTTGVVQMSKTDPGPTLPWKQLAAEEVGVWPNQECSNEDSEDLSAERAQELLNKVGYHVPKTGKFDNATKYTMGAARLRWTPSCFKPTSGSAQECYDKPFDKDLSCALRNLLPTDRHQDNTFSPLPIILLSIGAPLLLIFLMVVLYKYCKRNQRDNYEEIPDAINADNHFRM